MHLNLGIEATARYMRGTKTSVNFGENIREIRNNELSLRVFHLYLFANHCRETRIFSVLFPHTIFSFHTFVGDN